MAIHRTKKKKHHTKRSKRTSIIEEYHESMTSMMMTYMMCTVMYGFTSILEFATGSKGKSIYRERVPVHEIYRRLGDKRFRRAYRMNVSTFYKLHRMLKTALEEKFFPKGGGKRNYKKSDYCIDTDIRLSIAIRFFAGGKVDDIALVHGVSPSAVYETVWKVLDCINECEKLSINFPNHAQQKNIARGFFERSGAGFKNVIGAIDGLLVWINKPPKKVCKNIKCNEGKFKCGRKDKFGFNLQAICDHKLRFTWIDIQWPGSSSDYLAWVTSKLCQDLDKENSNIFYEGATLVGDNAYVKKKYMAVPLKGKRAGTEDGYCFYLSQLRITIERAFGALVHRFAILRAPLCVPTCKVASLVSGLCRLHNFLIDENEDKIDKLEKADLDMLKKRVSKYNRDNCDEQGIVQFRNGIQPYDLLDLNATNSDMLNRRPESDTTPMDLMILHCEEGGWGRPAIRICK